MVTQREIHRFEEIMEEIKNLADEALALVPQSEKSRAEAYWHPWLKNVVDNRGCMVTMEDTLNSMKEDLGDDFDEEDEMEDGCRYCGSQEFLMDRIVHHITCKNHPDNQEERSYYQYRRGNFNVR